MQNNKQRTKRRIDCQLFFKSWLPSESRHGTSFWDILTRTKFDLNTINVDYSNNIHRYIEITRCLQCDTSNQSNVMKSYALCDVFS